MRTIGIDLGGTKTLSVLVEDGVGVKKAKRPKQDDDSDGDFDDSDERERKRRAGKSGFGGLGRV